MQDGHHYVLPVREERLAYEFVTATSAAQILNLLGYEEESRELIRVAKSLAGELSLHLSTGKYLDDLASRLAAELGTLWEKDFDEFKLAELLNAAIALKSEIGVAAPEALREKATEVLKLLLETFGKDRKTTPTLSSMLDNPDPETVLQTVCTALVVGVGGLNGD